MIEPGAGPWPGLFFFQSAMSNPTYFERLGLPRRYDLDLDEVERAYLNQSRALHPDFHQLGSTAQQQVSLEMTSLLNLAYTTLKHPFQRGEYLLGLEGGPSASEARQMSPEFLEETLELRMQIQELRLEGPDSPALLKLEEELQQRRTGMIQSLSNDFARLLATPADAPQRKAVALQIRQTLNAAKYLQGLLNDLRSD